MRGSVRGLCLGCVKEPVPVTYPSLALTFKFKIERIDIPENDEEREWLAKQDFRNTAEDAYTG